MVWIHSLGFAVAAATYAAAQTNQTIAQCTNSTYQWTFNSLNQSPCQMASFLGGVCNAGTFSVPPLTTGLVYIGPTPGEANGCRCSSVFYSLISACALCQSDQFLKWSAYNGNCSVPYLGIFPFDIPNGTKIPDWAYQDVSASDQFLPTAAQTVLSLPESTHTGQPTSTSSVTASTTSSTSSATSVPATSSGSSSSSNAGAIAGGVVGGVVGLALIAALIFWWMRRRRAQPASAALLDPTSAAPMSPVSPTTFVQTATFGTTSPRLYDPSDPSTFPSSPADSSAPPPSMQEYQPQAYPQSTYSNPSQPLIPGPSYATANQGPRYTGVPEL